MASTNKTCCRGFDECLRSVDSQVQVAARELAERFGRHLGYVLLTLTLDRSDPETRAYREYWSTIRTVWLGGGIVSGNLGRIMLDTARRSLEAAGSRLTLNVAPPTRILPVVGAARSLEPECAGRKNQAVRLHSRCLWLGGIGDAIDRVLAVVHLVPALWPDFESVHLTAGPNLGAVVLRFGQVVEVECVLASVVAADVALTAKSAGTACPAVQVRVLLADRLAWDRRLAFVCKCDG
jgi:hypothetical protein